MTRINVDYPWYVNQVNNLTVFSHICSGWAGVAIATAVLGGAPVGSVICAALFASGAFWGYRQSEKLRAECFVEFMEKCGVKAEVKK